MIDDIRSAVTCENKSSQSRCCLLHLLLVSFTFDLKVMHINVDAVRAAEVLAVVRAHRPRTLGRLAAHIPVPLIDLRHAEPDALRKPP